MTSNTKAKLIVFLNTLTLIGGAITIILLLRVIGNAAQQNTDTNTQIAASQKVTEKELRCLASFFSQSNRQNIRISNLESCQIIHTDTGLTEDLPLSPSPVKPQSSPAVPSSDTKQNSTTTTTPTQVNTPQKASTNTAPSQTAPQVPSTPSTPTTPDPVKVLGIQVCVPFTHICMR